MRRAAQLFFCALQFLTRLPGPRLKDFQPDWIARSTPFYPVAGWIVGAIGAAAMLAASRLWPMLPASALAVTVALLVTGGFHEDGLADTADGLGGGQTPQRRLEIMKDSRIGSYGVLALWASLTIKVCALSTMPPLTAALVFVLSHGAARALPVVVMAAFRYAGDPEAAKLKPSPMGVRPLEALAALAIGLGPLPFLLPPLSAALAVVLAMLGAALVASAARRLIGGFTGDVLGAVEQAAEVGLMLGFSAHLGGIL